MSAHTPGPWAAFTDGNHTNIVAYVPRTDCIFSLPGHNKHEPNVRLIAAAPDLYAALQILVSRIEFYSSMGASGQPNIEQWEYTEGSSDMAIARAALAKARGEE